MSTPVPQSEKAPRRSERRQKKLLSVEDGALGATASETDVSKLHILSNPQSSTPGPKQAKANRKPQAKKYQQQPDSEGVEAHHAKPRQQPKPDKAAATPIKAAYAASTFLNSPAPSTLPMPSFYSRSVPNTAILGMTEEGKDSVETSRGATEITPGEDGLPIRHRESTPLDFLFEAARKAKGTPRAESPNGRSQSVSVRGESPYNRGSPAPREGGAVFPFELEETNDRSDEPTQLSTPLRENTGELRPQTAPSQYPSLQETDRRAKTDALKKLLMNAQPLRTASVSPRPLDPRNPFNARPAPARSLHQDQNLPHYRHHSGPSTPVPSHHGHQRLPHVGFDGPTDIQNGNVQSPSYTPRPPSSQLRNIYQPSPMNSTNFFDGHQSSGPLVSTAPKHDLRSHAPRQAPVGIETPEPTSKSNRRADSSAQQLEDDLRRVLKLDLASKG